MRRTLPALVLLFVVACGEEVAPASFVNKFRVLSVVATPPDLRPGETTTLTALVVDPSRPGRPHTLIWLACDPDPQDLSRSSCSDVSTLSDPSGFTPAPGSDPATAQLPPGVRAIGFGDFATYRAPEETFANVDAADARRVQGAVAQLLVVAIAAELPLNPTPEQRDALFEKVRSKDIASLLVLFRVRVTEDPQRNANPVVSDLRVDSVPLPDGATARFFKDRPTPLELVAPDDAFEKYEQQTPQGLEQKTEQLVAAHYSTTGRFEVERLQLRSGTPQSFEPPDDTAINPVPEDGRGTFWIVLRDTRGGQAFVERPFFLCDEALPPPQIDAVSPSTGAADGTQLLTFSGTDLSSALDILVGGKALLAARYDSERGVFEGRVPTLPTGDHAIIVRGQHCADVPTTLTYRTP